MNWRRGFFRLWLVAAVLWLAVFSFVVKDKVAWEAKVLWANFNCYPTEEELEEMRQRAPEDFVPVIGEQCVEHRAERIERLARYGAAMLSPPLGVLVLGIVGFWIARGFRRN